MWYLGLFLNLLAMTCVMLFGYWNGVLEGRAGNYDNMAQPGIDKFILICVWTAIASWLGATWCMS